MKLARNLFIISLVVFTIGILVGCFAGFQLSIGAGIAAVALTLGGTGLAFAAFFVWVITKISEQI